MFVSRKLHYCGSSYSPGYTSDFLGIPIDLGYQLRDFSVSVLTWKMGLRIREILIAKISKKKSKFHLNSKMYIHVYININTYIYLESHKKSLTAYVIDWLFGHIKTYDRSVAEFIFMRENPDRY